MVTIKHTAYWASNGEGRRALPEGIKGRLFTCAQVLMSVQLRPGAVSARRRRAPRAAAQPISRREERQGGPCWWPAQREEGQDTFGYYMNGCITAGQVLHFLVAYYVVGEPGPADQILRAMLERQARDGFENGAVDSYPEGID